jgi:hypothetical protein
LPRWCHWAWWTRYEFPGGKIFTPAAGIASLAVIPLGALLALVMFALIATAKRLVISDACVQLLSKGRVVVHIPYANVAGTDAQGEAGAGTVAFILARRDDPGTLVPSWTKDRFEVQSLVYGRPPEVIHQAVQEHLKRYWQARSPSL